MASALSDNELDVLVIDSGAIIKGHGMNFHRSAKRLVTIPEVIDEIRDSKSREILDKLPFELEIITPSDQAMGVVAEFARKSGDFSALSLVDLKVLALSYQFECQLHEGGKYLRKQPRGSIRAAQQKQKGPATSTSTTTPSQLEIDTPTRVADTSGGPDSNLTEDKDEDEDEDGSEGDDNEGQQGQDGDVNEFFAAVDGEEGEEDDDYEDAEYSAWKEEFSQEQQHYLYDRQETSPKDTTDSVTANMENINLEEACDEDFPTFDMLDSDGVFQGEKGKAIEVIKTAPVSSGWSKIAKASAAASPDSNEKKESSEAALDTAPTVLTTTATKAAPVTTTIGGKAVVDPLAVKKVIPANPIATPEIDAAASYFAGNSSTEGTGSSTSSKELQSISNVSRILTGSGSGVHTSRIAQDRAALEDDGSGWITASNYQECLVTGRGMFGNETLTDVNHDTKMTTNATKNVNGSKHGNRASPVGCVTTDFTMQNVMLQMNMKIVSVNGMVVSSVKQWVMRCMACYHIHYDMDKLFCERCGAHHMSRVACHVDTKTGKLHLHLKKGYQVSRRGMVHSLPKPGKQGKFQGELLLREDQLQMGIWRQKVVKINKDVKSGKCATSNSTVGSRIKCRFCL